MLFAALPVDTLGRPDGHRTKLVAAAALALVLAGCGGGDSPTAPVSPVAVTMTISPAAPKPGDVVTITVTATPPDTRDGVKIVRLDMSGLLTFRDSLLATTSGSVTLSDVVTMPLDHGTVTVVASAQTGGSTGSNETRLTLSDDIPPTFPQVTTTPPNAVVQPGDTLAVAFSVADGVSLRYSVVRVTGAITAVDSVAYLTRTPTATRTARFAVPATTALGGVIQVAIDAGNVGGAVGHYTIPTAYTVRDVTKPTLTATLSGSQPNGLYAPGDTVRIALNAGDNVAIARAGYVFGAPANVRDSAALAGRSGTASFALIVPSAWLGDVPVTLFAVDGAGNRTELTRTLTVTSTRSIALADARDLAYDARRGRVYASRPAAGQVAVVQVDGTGPLSLLAPIAVGGNPRGLDLTLSGDSLIVALGTPALAFVSLGAGVVSTETVITDTFLDRRTDNVRVAANGRAIFTATFSGSGYGGAALQYDIATRTVISTANAGGLTTTEVVPLAASGNRKRVYGLIDDSCCPEDGFVYDATTSRFSKHGTVSNYGSLVATDSAGTGFLIGQSLYGPDLLLVRSLANGSAGPVALSPDALFAYFGTPTGVMKVRVADSSIMTSYRTNDPPRRLLLSPDGATLFMISATALYRIDVR